MLFVCLVLLTCAGQMGNLYKERNLYISDAVKQEVKEITERNRNESEQRLVEVAAIKEVCVV